LGALAALGACAFAVTAAQRTSTHQPEFSPLRTITTALDRAVRRGETVLVTQQGFAALPLTPLVKYSLRRRGVHVVGYERRMRVGPSYELGRHGYDLHLEVAEAHQPATKHATVLARVTLTAAPWLPGAEAPRVITVSAARPGQR
jgi:antitoxin (DNA-binding transcriptional repressor) of toxin-antitoxin stability system